MTLRSPLLRPTFVDDGERSAGGGWGRQEERRDEGGREGVE